MAEEKKVNWTPAQRAGIETTGVNLLVSAAAGSGKTAVLAERCAHLICHPESPCDVDELLVVTFTEAAAGQMKSRIGAALQKRAEAEPENARLQSQLAQIDRAQVSTLHGFCSRLLRQHFHLVGLDPAFVILDGEEAKLLRSEVVRQLFAERYETDESGVFQKLIDVYADGDDELLQDRVLRTHELLCSVTEPAGWLSTARSRLREAVERPLRDSTLGRELAAVVRARLDGLNRRCEESVASLQRLDGLAKVAAYLASLGAVVKEWSDRFGDGDFDALARGVSALDVGRKPPVPKDHPHKAAADAAIEAVRTEMGEKGELYALCRFSAQEWRDGVRSMQPFAEVFLDLVVEFRQRYAAAKARTRGIDFADLERFTLEVLGKASGDGAWTPSPVAEALHRRIVYVLVDEYQDINAVQDEILRLVSRESRGAATADGALPPNLFCVGDVKQSIYGFRLAEPERFLGRYHRYREDRSAGQVIDLQQNFRSRPPLLDSINALFERLMTREAADIDYDEKQRLVPGATFPPADGGEICFKGSPIELHVLPRDLASGDEGGDDAAAADLDRTEREALLIAHRIQQLTGKAGGPPTYVKGDADKGEPALRPIEYRDVVILLRSTVYKAEQIAEVLRRFDIPVYRDSGSGYFNTPEVRDLLSLLHLLDNAKQDIPLAAVLRSPLSGLSYVEDKLARVRLAYPRGEQDLPFHEAVYRYTAERDDDLAKDLSRFVASLDRWRSLSRRRPLPEVIWTVLEETGYLAFCAGLDNGPQRCANLMHLHDRAKQFGSTAGRGLYRFLRSLDRLREEADLGSPSVLGEGENVVRVMSVHKSKGLEFPVVFLPDLGKRFNLQDCGGRVLLDRTRYLGMAAIDEAKQVRYPSLASVLVRQRLRQQMMAEELRVLYVALTRAKEHLILIGTCDEKSVDQWRTFWGGHRGRFPADAVLGASTPLEWVGPAAVSLDGEGQAAFELIPHTAAEVGAWGVTATRKVELTPWQCARAALQPLDPPPAAEPTAQEAIARLGYRYPFEAFTHLRAAVAATDLAKSRSVVPSAISRVNHLLPLPRCVSGHVAMTASERGTATHLVLQHLDFRNGTGEGLRHQIAQMESRRLILAAQVAAVDIEAVEWLVRSDLGQMIAAAEPSDLMREVPFAVALSDGGKWEGLDQPMLRGRIDLLIRRGKQCVIVDYKTDQVTGADLSERSALYGKQVEIYRRAVRQLTGYEIGTVYLAFLSARELLEM